MCVIYKQYSKTAVEITVKAWTRKQLYQKDIMTLQADTDNATWKSPRKYFLWTVQIKCKTKL